MIEIKRKNLEPLVFEEATTVKEAVEYAVRNGISLKGADLSDTDLSGADLSSADLYKTNLRNADLSGADLTNADLSCTNLHDSDLTGADLTGALLDFSCLPLWCGSLNMKIDKKIFCQLLYHALRAGKSVEDKEVAEFLTDPKALALANQFHRAEVCGKILQEKTEGR